VAGWPKTSRRENKERWWCRARKDARLGIGGLDGGIPFYGRSGAATVIQNYPRLGPMEQSGGGSAGLDKGRSMRSR
jgi:hypothetical protein